MVSGGKTLKKRVKNMVGNSFVFVSFALIQYCIVLSLMTDERQEKEENLRSELKTMLAAHWKMAASTIPC